MKNSFSARALAAAIFSFGVASAAAAPNPSGVGFEAAKEQVKKLKVPDGLEVTLFASEPMVVNPANMDIDARGRVWSTEGANYRLFQKWGKLRPEGDRIVILEDTNGDGAADKQTVFYQGNDVNSALGICVLGKKVYVSCAPNVLVFSDENGDDKADGPPQVLFTGISGVDHDHGVHAFVFGPDGKLYFNQGNDGRQIKKADGSPMIDKAGNEVNGKGKPYRQGLVFRCNIDGSEFETLGWNFRNNYEVCVDSFGTLWQSDNDDDGNKGVRINYVMEFGSFGYADEMTGAHWSAGWNKAKAKGAAEDTKVFHEWHQHDPGTVPNLLHTGAGSPTGITIYEGNLLPEVFRNQIIHCDAGPNTVRAYPVENDGAGYKARMVDLLTSEDSWYRPSDVTVAPDGSVFVADWNDAAVGGHFMADQSVDTMSGRIYRVAPKGHKYAPAKVDVSTPQGAVAALQSPNLATRYLGWTALHTQQDKAESALQKLWNGKDARERARALHLLARIKGKEQKYIDEAARDSDPNIRLTALRIARQTSEEAAMSTVKKLAKDSNPQVRRECAIALRHSKSPAAAEIWAVLASQYDGKDRWALEALGIGADQQWDAFLDAWLAEAGDKWNSPAGREIVWRSRAKKTPGLLVKLINDKDTQPEQRERYMRSLDFVSGPEKDAALLELLTGGK